MISRNAVTLLVILILSIATVAPVGLLHAQVLVGDPFSSPNMGWVDAFPDRAGNWRLSLHNPTLMNTNNANPPTSGAVTNDGSYEPDVLIQDGFMAPGTYDLNATMRTNDDDIIGLVWNYQDPDNYFRVGIRQQAAGSFGGTQGLAVQKIVGGVLTQISPNGTGVGAPSPIDQAIIDNRTPFDLQVAVDGSNYEVFFNGASIVSGTDPDLASGRKVGALSWAQQSDVAAVTPYWGTEVESIAVTGDAGTLYSETFAARPHQWRPLVMTNSAGVSTNTAPSKETIGNFGLDVDNPWIVQHSNGFEWATETAPNIDFIGPAVVIDEPGSENFTDYEMRVRLGSSDDDGLGVVVRAQDDDNFYRINVATQSMAATNAWERAPRGLSVQKVLNGVWSELFRDDQDNPLFEYIDGEAGQTPESGLPMFDLIVRAVGNTLAIEVIDPDGNVINFPLITDANDPIFAGRVGLTTWGNDNSYWTNFGGEAGPLLTVIPEPAAVMLAILAALALWGAGRRR